MIGQFEENARRADLGGPWRLLESTVALQIGPFWAQRPAAYGSASRFLVPHTVPSWAAAISVADCTHREPGGAVFRADSGQGHFPLLASGGRPAAQTKLL